MDLAVLPEIFALGLLIVAYRPIVRRGGAHVNLWFLGWTFILAHYIIVLVAGQRPAGPFAQALAVGPVELCGLAFMLAASSTRTRKINWIPFVILAVPVLLQAALASVAWPRWPALPDLLPCAVNVLFAAPLVFLLIIRERRHALLITAAGFAALGLLTLPFAAAQPAVVIIGTQALLFISAAYLALSTAHRFHRGVLATAVGLALWGLEFPAIAAIRHFDPTLHLDYGLMQLPRYLVMAGSLLTLLEEYLQRTERMAMHDHLTDLPNRRLFEERFAAALAEAQRDTTTIACLVIDVDGFKAINDTLGHDVGDGLLTAVATRLAWHMGPRDILARTGGDEFTAMLGGVTDEHHLRFVASAMMSAASVPVAVQGHSIDVRISVGIALSPDDADDIESLLKAADQAMYRAKRRGGNLLVFAGEPDTQSDPPTPPDDGLRETSARILQMATPGSKRLSQS